jgi:hypothetical protein
MSLEGWKKCEGVVGELVKDVGELSKDVGELSMMMLAGWRRMPNPEGVGVDAG